MNHNSSRGTSNAKLVKLLCQKVGYKQDTPSKTKKVLASVRSFVTKLAKRQNTMETKKVSIKGSSSQSPIDESEVERAFRYMKSLQDWIMIKYNPNRLTRHHRKPTSLGGSNNPFNISYVPRRAHEFWHALWGNKPVEEIVEEMNQKWIPPNYRIHVERLWINRSDLFTPFWYNWKIEGVYALYRNAKLVSYIISRP